jgi:V8-like Glu-specific endopeptidase
MSWRTAFRWLGRPRLSRAAGRQPSARPRLEGLEERLALSVDFVPGTGAFPWSAVVRIESYFPGDAAGAFTEATGALIDPYHVLTAGHVIYSHADGGFADSVRVFPGQQGQGVTPFGEADATFERTYSSFVNADNAGGYTETGDLALITLDRPVGNAAGWFGLGYVSDLTSYSGMALNTAGYPAEQGFSGYNQYHQFGNIAGATPDGALLSWDYSSITAIAGQSGSPLWVYDPATGKRTVYGVLVSGNDPAHTGFADRITPNILADLQGWESQDGGPKAGAPLGSAVEDFGSAGATGPGGSVAGQAGGLTVGSPGAGVGIGAVDTTTGTWYLHSAENAGAPDDGVFRFGSAGWIPVVGDWTGAGQVGIGMFDPATGTWYLRSSPTPGAPDVGVFRFGGAGWIPVVGDWTGSGHTGIGAFDPSTGTFYLRDEASAGGADAGSFQFGGVGWLPVAGHWDGGPATHIGAFDPTTATWYLRNENSSGQPDAGQFQFGGVGWLPVVGHWDGGTAATVGAFDPTTGMWYLRNQNSSGATTTLPFAYGAPGWIPVAGAWGGVVDVPRSAEFIPLTVRADTASASGTNGPSAAPAFLQQATNSSAVAGLQSAPGMRGRKPGVAGLFDDLPA